VVAVVALPFSVWVVEEVAAVVVVEPA
jgi:hypothetical protein